jgi:hypothetical protein
MLTRLHSDSWRGQFFFIFVLDDPPFLAHLLCDYSRFLLFKVLVLATSTAANNLVSSRVERGGS